MHRTSLPRQKFSILHRTIVALCCNVQPSFDAGTPICFYLKGTHLTDIACSSYPSWRLVPHEPTKKCRNINSKPTLKHNKRLVDPVCIHTHATAR